MNTNQAARYVGIVFAPGEHRVYSELYQESFMAPGEPGIKRKVYQMTSFLKIRGSPGADFFISGFSTNTVLLPERDNYIEENVFKR